MTMLRIALKIPYVCLAAVAILLLRRFLKARPSAPLPPGPRPLPLVGNILEMPTEHAWIKFAEWGQKYGNIVHVDLFGKSMIILNSARDAMELLDKKSSIYSERQSSYVTGELVGWSESLAFLPYGTRFREYRRLLHRVMGTRAQVDKYSPLQESHMHRFLGNVLRDPDNVAVHIRRLVGSVILKLSYGYDVQDGSDPMLNLAKKTAHQLIELQASGAFVVDLLPFIRFLPSWFPGAGWKKLVEPYRKNLAEAANVPFEFVKSRMRDNTNIANFTSELLESEDLDDEKIHKFKWAGLSFYAGGEEPVVSAIHSFFLAMVLYPDVQRRAQEEMDSVVGADRLPTPADRPHLPYLEAVISEVYRWNPIGPLVPHAVREDDVHEGYLIPKGAIIVANVWAMLHDPENYPDPSEFNPMRYLGTPPAPDPRDCRFGFGRRICPGMHLADASVFLSCASSLAVFNVSATIEIGKIVEPKVRFTSGIVSHPEPFRCSIKPRSAMAEALILAYDEQK